MEEKKTKLRTGYTTGSSATAAAKSALLSIINQQKTENVDIYYLKRLQFKFQYILVNLIQTKQSALSLKMVEMILMSPMVQKL